MAEGHARKQCKYLLTRNFSRGNKGALRVPILSFQYLRRLGHAAQLLCFHTAGGFESHRLHQSF